jgi:hypothetical protein
VKVRDIAREMITTPLMAVLQHDFIFQRSFTSHQAIVSMCRYPEINYIGLPAVKNYLESAEGNMVACRRLYADLRNEVLLSIHYPSIQPPSHQWHSASLV